MKNSLRAAVAALASLVLVGTGLTATVSPASAVANTVLCRTFDGCAALGMTAHGYERKMTKSYWRMTEGHNCTNYVAYLMVQQGMKNSRPWDGNGNANGWGYYDNPLDKVPAVGAVAWWDANRNGAGSLGHVAYVEAVLSPDLIVISEDNWGGEFYWRVIRKGDAGWPTGFLHFADTNAANNVTEWSSVPLTQTVYADSSKRRSIDPQYIKPGATVWASLTYQNLGSAEWTGMQLATDGPFDHASAISTGWPSASRAASQRQNIVGIGQTATFDFPVTIPADAVTGTTYTESFVPAVAGGGAIPSTAVSMTFRADTRDLFLDTTAPVLTGIAREGLTLTADPGLWDPVVDAFEYQWLRAGTPIAGATAATYTLSSADVGLTVSVDVTATKANYVPVTLSATSALVASASPRVLPVGKSLTVDRQLVSRNGTFRVTQTAGGKLVVANRFTKEVVFTTGKKQSVRTKLRPNGRLVSLSAAGKPVWDSGTKGKKVTRAVITDAGKLLLRTGSNKVVWNSAKAKR